MAIALSISLLNKFTVTIQHESINVKIRYFQLRAIIYITTVIITSFK